MKTYQLMVLASVLLLSACVRKDKGFDGTPAPVKVEVIQVGAETGSSSSRYSGTVEEENGTILSFATAGTVEGVFFKEGQRVSKGQLLATLNSTQARNLYDAAKASLAQATDACRRMKELHDKGSLPDIKWVDAQTALDQVRSAERVAAKSLADCRLYAPFSGVIADKSVERGQNVAPGSPVGRLVTVGDNYGSVTACYWSDYAGNGIGSGNGGETTLVDGTDVTRADAVDAMNAALQNAGSEWRYELTGELPTLKKEE